MSMNLDKKMNQVTALNSAIIALEKNKSESIRNAKKLEGVEKATLFFKAACRQVKHMEQQIDALKQMKHQLLTAKGI